MTVISAVITRHYTAHASDSFITIAKADGSVDVVENHEPKLVFVKHWHGVLAYWGLARCKGYSWSTLAWLRKQANFADKFPSAEEFAHEVGNKLSIELAKIPLPNPRDKGIGIHFTAYEDIGGEPVPELFLISNWADIPYTTLRPNGVGVSRETYHTLKNVPSASEHSKAEYRLEVRNFLNSAGMFAYNNGDPEVFNPVANGVFSTLRTLVRRGVLKSDSQEIHCNMARRPIQLVVGVLQDFSVKHKRVIGGKYHDLCVSPSGECFSTTSDCP